MAASAPVESWYERPTPSSYQTSVRPVLSELMRFVPPASVAGVSRDFRSEAKAALERRRCGVLPVRTILRPNGAECKVCRYHPLLCADRRGCCLPIQLDNVDAWYELLARVSEPCSLLPAAYALSQVRQRLSSLYIVATKPLTWGAARVKLPLDTRVYQIGCESPGVWSVRSVEPNFAYSFRVIPDTRASTRQVVDQLAAFARDGLISALEYVSPQSGVLVLYAVPPEGGVPVAVDLLHAEYEDPRWEDWRVKRVLPETQLSWAIYTGDDSENALNAADLWLGDSNRTRQDVMQKLAQAEQMGAGQRLIATLRDTLTWM